MDRGGKWRGRREVGRPDNERGWRAELECWMDAERCHNSSGVDVCARDSETKGEEEQTTGEGQSGRRLEGRLLIFNNLVEKNQILSLLLLFWLLCLLRWCLNSGRFSGTFPETAQRSISLAGERERRHARLSFGVLFVIMFLFMYNSNHSTKLPDSHWPEGDGEKRRLMLL